MHAVSKFTDDILKCIDNKKVAITTSMDLSKAFDYLNHDILFTKLRKYNVNFQDITMDKELPLCQKTLCLLESDPFTYIILKLGVPQG